MTLAIALRGSNGLVLASDSRVSGAKSKDDSIKFLQVNRDVGIMTYGLAIPGGNSIRKLRDNVSQKQLAHFSQIVEETRIVAQEEFNIFFSQYPQNPFSSTVGFILAGYDSYESNQFKIFSYESPFFMPTENTDVKAAQWHLSQVLCDYLQYPQMTVEQLKELAVIQLLETSSFNATVGGPIQMATVSYEKGFRQLQQEEVHRLIENVQPKIISFRKSAIKTFNELLI